MTLFSKRNIVVGVVALAVGIAAVFGIGKVSGAFGQSSENITGTVLAFTLNPEGKPVGAILSTGDQVQFGAETGLLVAQQIKVGDALTASGKGGTRSDHGREFRAETLQIGGNTITIVKAKGGPKHGSKQPGGDKGPKGKKPSRQEPDAGAPQPEVEGPIGGTMPTPPTPRETVSTNANVRYVLVNGGGEPKGLILSDGTQMMLPKKVNEKNLTFTEQTAVSVEGEAAKSEFGVFIKPIRLTIGDQTFSFNR